MHRHSVTHVLPFTPDQLFDLVGDVRRYPEFVPWIATLSVESERAEGEGISVLDAEVSVGFAFLKERFATRVRRDRSRGEITVQLLHGPFKTLANRWRVFSDPTGVRIEFVIDFEFKSKLLQAVLAKNFEHAVERLIGCFEERAKALYG